ncbi:EAL domain-containing protein [Cohnella boryungensis]|uniref:EAL domain-containing protein n=1 Tax=Cohnella boryungensis TaxID=768479 RepID=A0ABV8SBS9_9BACL
MKIQTLLDRISLICRLVLPNRSLKFFPPDFTLRRPIVALLHKSLKAGKVCYLTLFRLEMPHIQQDIPREDWDSFLESGRRHLRLSAVSRLNGQQLIAIDQHSRTEFILLCESSGEKEQGMLAPMELEAQMNGVRSDLEIGLAGNRPDWRSALRIVSASVPVAAGTHDVDGGQVLQDSYSAALALATGTVTPQMEQLRGQLELVLEKGSIQVLAQPIMNLNTGDIYGWEILTRGPEGTVLHSPEKLFQFAEQSRLLSRLEFLVVKKALEEISASEIREPIFLNVTAVTLSHPLFLSHVLQCLEKLPGLSAQQIYFEITERHQITNFDEMIEILRRFRKHGFRFAVDDAGSGYSSLQWIGELVPELIKVDRSVIRHVDRVAIKESLLRAIVMAAREMKCEIVAEGVEREEEADVLFKLEVDMGQGYYFARPNVLLHENEREMLQETKDRIQYRRGLVAS